MSPSKDLGNEDVSSGDRTSSSTQRRVLKVIGGLGGAISDVESDATAFGCREAEFMVVVSAGWQDPADDEAHLEWAEESWNDLRESDATLEGFYPGFPGFVDGEERARMAYGDNLDRLANLKANYDPENLLHSNLNVTPTR